MEVPVWRQELCPVPQLLGRELLGGAAGEGRAGVTTWGAGDVAWSAVGARLKPTKLTAIISTFLGDQLSGRGSAGERIPLLEVVRFSVALFHLVCYRCIVKYVSGFLVCLLLGVAGLCMPCGRSPAIAKDVPQSTCSFLFLLLSTVSYPNSFLFFLHFAVQIKDSQARRWQGKLILLLLLGERGVCTSCRACRKKTVKISLQYCTSGCVA